MIAEVVVCVAKHDVECHSAIKFSEILAHIGTPTKDEINNVKIVIAIPAEVKHWHGAAKDSWFQHLIYHRDAQEGASNEWLELWKNRSVRG